MPNQYRKTSRVILKRKVNRRRTKKGGASVSGDDTHKYEWEKELLEHFKIDNSEGFSLQDIKTVLYNVVSPGLDLRPGELSRLHVPNLRTHLNSLGREKKKKLNEIVNEKLAASKEPRYGYGATKIMDGTYSLGNTRLLPEEKITRKKIQKIIDDFNEDIKYNPPDGSREALSVSTEIGILDSIKYFIFYFTPQDLPKEELSADVVEAAANLFGQGVEPQSIESNDSECRGRNCSIMGGYKKKSKRKSKKKSNRKSKKGGNGCGIRGGNHCNTKKRGGHGHAIHKKK